MPATPYERQADGSLVPLTLRGRYLGKVGGVDQYETPTVSIVPAAFTPEDYLALSPEVAVSMPSRTSATVVITAAANPPPRGPITEYRISRAQGSAGFATVATIPASGSLSWTDTGLATATPEIVWRYIVEAISGDGVGPESNIATVQWTAAPLQQPLAPTGLAATGVQASQVTLSWAMTTDATVTKLGIFTGTTLLVDNLPAGATSYTWSGLTAATPYNNINVRRYNGFTGAAGVPGWSMASNSVAFTTKAAAGASLFLGHVPGRIFFGWSTNHNEGSASVSSNAEFQLNQQTPFVTAAPSGVDYASLLGVRRLYNKVADSVTWADQQNRILWISAKGDELGAAAGLTGWQQIASGSRDANIVSYFNSLVARNTLTIFTFHHEPIGDLPTNGAEYVNAAERIMKVVDSNFPGHRIVFAPNYEENRLRNTNGGTINWATWLPERICPNRGGARPFDFISFDMYQYNADTSTNVRSGVQFSHRWWRIDEMFTGAWRSAGTSAMPWMTYTPGVDIVFGIGECAQRPGAFYQFETGGASPSNMTGAKYTRDMLDYVFANVDKFWCVSWFNSIGADLTYNDERLYPGTNTWGGKTPNHPSLVQQTGDTELAINIYREKLRSALTVKLANNGLPAA